MQKLDATPKWLNGLSQRKIPGNNGLEAQGTPHRIFLHGSHIYENLDSLEDLHHNRFGWPGIGYHFVIDKDGRATQTRPLDIMGGHVYGRNNGSIGIVLLEKHRSLLNTHVLESFRELYDRITSELGTLPVDSHTHGQAEVINETIARMNRTRDHPLPYIQTDKTIATEEDTQRFQDQMRRLTRGWRRPDASPLEKELLKQTENIKPCPGDLYFRFTEGLPRSTLSLPNAYSPTR